MCGAEHFTIAPAPVSAAERISVSAVANQRSAVVGAEVQ
jgi:hypothetical protein